MYEYFQLAGARTLLGPFREIPPDPALTPVIRGLWDAHMAGGRNLYEVAPRPGI